MKEIFKDAPEQQEADERDSYYSEQGKPGNMYASKVSKNEAQELAKEMYKGCDKHFKPHMKEVTNGFKKSKNLQKQREKLMKEHAVLQ